MTTQILIAVASIIFAAAISYYFALRKARNESASEDDADLVKRISELEKQLAIVGTQIAPLNTVFQSMLVKQLTHAHTPYQDALMKKLGGEGIPPTITEEEEVALVEVLKQIAADPAVPEAEREAAKILPTQMKRVKRDAQALASGEARLVDIQVVGRVEAVDGPKE